MVRILAGTHSHQTEKKEAKLREEAHRCPCFTCATRAACLVECPAFKRYTDRGK